MITRHFYPLHGVAEALYQSVGSTKDPLRKTKIAFWFYELYISEEYEFLKDTLDRIWKRYGSPMYVPSIETEEAALTSLWSIQNEQLPTLFPSFDATILQNLVEDAKRNRRGVRLYRLLAGLPTETQSFYLGATIDGSIGFQHELVRLGYEWYPATQTKGVWPSLSVGRRSSRVFCLPKSLMGQGLDASGLDILEGSAVWRRILQESGCDISTSKEKGILCFESDESYEAFYSTYFPDDIPDEWSVAERSKSHTVPRIT
jgi:hypothetical protein